MNSLPQAAPPIDRVRLGLEIISLDGGLEASIGSRPAFGVCYICFADND